MSAARALFVTRAPMRRPPSSISSISASGNIPMSTRCAGVSICIFMRSMRLVPPATNLAAGWAAAAQASATPLTRSYRKGVMSGLLRPRRGLLRRCWHRRRSGRCCRSSAAGDLGIAEGRRGRDIRSYMAWPTGLVFGQQRHSRANLARSAVPALKSIMAQKCGLHRMQISVLCTKPSIVVISSPSCIAARVKQLLMRCPLTITVQAPHCPWSQPFFVPVSARCSRSASSNVVRGSRSRAYFRPLTVAASHSVRSSTWFPPSQPALPAKPSSGSQTPTVSRKRRREVRDLKGGNHSTARLQLSFMQPSTYPALPSTRLVWFCFARLGFASISVRSAMLVREN